MPSCEASDALEVTRTRRALFFVAAAALVVASLDIPGTAQGLGWTDQFGTDKNDVAWSVSSFGSSVYVCGVTESLLAGLRSSGEDDAFVRAYALDGTESWTRQFGTRRDEQCFGVAVGTAGITTVGRTFGRFPGENRRGAFDVFVRTYDQNGERLWTQQFGTPNNDVAFSVASAPNGDLFVAGSTQGSLAGERYRGAGDAFVRKLDASGAVAWTREFGSRGTDVAFAVAADATGVYVAGATTGALPGERNRGEFDLFVRKYDANGSHAWTRQLGTDKEDFGYGIAVVGSTAYVAGATKGKFVEPGAGGGDALLIEFDAADGDRGWLRQFGTDKTDQAFAVASDGSVLYVVGTTDSAFEGYANQGEKDAFARAFDADGSELWTFQFGSDRKDSANWAAAGPDGVFIAGHTEGTLPTQTAVEKRDAFIAAIG
jgi:hypothetical protein